MVFVFPFLTSPCTTVSRSIHLTANNSISFPFLLFSFNEFNFLSLILKVFFCLFLSLWVNKNFFWILFYLFLYSRFLLVINFIHISVYMSIPIAQLSPPPPPHPCSFPPLVSIRLFSTSVSQFLPCKSVHLYHFSRFHIYVFIYDICFSLSDLLHSVWQSLGPSMSLQMMQFHSVLWLSNIPLYICTTSSLSIHLSMDILVASMSWLM